MSLPLSQCPYTYSLHYKWSAWPNTWPNNGRLDEVGHWSWLESIIKNVQLHRLMLLGCWAVSTSNCILKVEIFHLAIDEKPLAKNINLIPWFSCHRPSFRLIAPFNSPMSTVIQFCLVCLKASIQAPLLGTSIKVFLVAHCWEDSLCCSCVLGVWLHIWLPQRDCYYNYYYYFLYPRYQWSLEIRRNCYERQE